MNHLHRRLQRLETAIRESGKWSTPIQTVVDCARRKLSGADCDLLKEVDALLDRAPHASLSEAHRAVWDRWEDAFARAVEETRFPFFLTATDLRL